MFSDSEVPNLPLSSSQHNMSTQYYLHSRTDYQQFVYLIINLIN